MKEDLDTIATIALAIPEKPTSGELLMALAQAEQAGYQRALIEAASRASNLDLPSILKRQAS